MNKRQRYNKPTRWVLIYTWLTGKPAPQVPAWDKSVLMTIGGVLYPRHPARLDQNAALLESVERELEILQGWHKFDLTTITLYNKDEMRRIFSHIIDFFEKGGRWKNQWSSYPHPVLRETRRARVRSHSRT